MADYCHVLQLGVGTQSSSREPKRRTEKWLKTMVMVDTTIVTGVYFMVYKPTYNWGPSCRWSVIFSFKQIHFFVIENWRLISIYHHLPAIYSPVTIQRKTPPATLVEYTLSVHFWVLD